MAPWHYFFSDRLPPGVLALAGFGPDDSYISSVDARCGAGWQEGFPNDRQLQCYMATSPGRLCDPEEKRHLIGIFSRYQRDYAAWNRGMLTASISAATKLSGNAMQLGLEAANMGAELDKKNPDMQKIGDIESSIDQMVSPMTNIAQQRMDNFIPHGDMVKNVAVLLSAGYITIDDFGLWGPPLLVEEAARSVGKVKSPCGPSS